MARDPLSRFADLIASHAFARAWEALRQELPESPSPQGARFGSTEQARREALLDRAAQLLWRHPRARAKASEIDRLASDSIHMRWQGLHAKLIQEGVNPTAVPWPRAPHPRSLSLLELCCANQDEVALEMLLESPKLDAQTLLRAREGTKMASPLLEALTTDWIDGLELMLRALGAPDLCESAPGARLRPLHAACTLGRPVLVQLLLMRKADPNALDEASGDDALTCALTGLAADGSANTELLSIIEALRDAGFDFPAWALRHRVYEEIEAIPSLFEPYAKALSIAENQGFSTLMSAPQSEEQAGGRL